MRQQDAYLQNGGGGMQLKLFATWYPRPLFKGNISIAILYAPYLAYSKLGLYGIDFLKISVRFRFVFLNPDSVRNVFGFIWFEINAVWFGY